jgi:formylglycine-generating enzyme required for sulfatase activity
VGAFTGRRFYRGDRLNATEANYVAQSSSRFEFIPVDYVRRFDATAPVGSYELGAYGLLDMMGNVREWCWDWWSPPPGYSTEAVSDPRGAAVGTRRVLRGGGWDQTASALRLAQRGYSGISDPEERGNIGFRPARNAP